MNADDILLTAAELEHLKTMMADTMVSAVLRKCTEQLAQRMASRFVLQDFTTPEGIQMATIMQAEIKALTGFWALLKQKAESKIPEDNIVDLAALAQVAQKAPPLI